MKLAEAIKVYEANGPCMRAAGPNKDKVLATHIVHGFLKEDEIAKLVRAWIKSQDSRKDFFAELATVKARLKNQGEL